MALVSLTSCVTPIKADVVVTMFPQYDIVRNIAGDDLTVHSILAPGLEVHDFEPSSQDMVTMGSARLVVYTSPTIDQWLDVSSFDDRQVKFVAMADHYQLDLEINGDNYLHAEDEIHFWVDPLMMVQLTDALLDEVILLDPANEADYRQNAATYANDLTATYDDFSAYLETNGYRESTLYFAGHNALGLFGARHHLDIVPLFEDFKPDEDLDSRQLIAFTEAIKESGTHYLFIEEMVQPRAALAIQSELARQDYALTLLELHNYHNRSPVDDQNDVSYIDLYQRNIANIKQALEGR